jgi:hypothetical protein
VLPVNGGLRDTACAESGVTFMEAVAPVALDDVPDRTADLVLGEAGGVQHVVE